MLVLTRKVDEQILIGDDIKITLLRVRGNSVRIGIEAPRSVQVVRGELEKRDPAKKQIIELELALDGDADDTVIDDLAEVFAHPAKPVTRKPGRETVANRILSVAASEPKTEIFVGTVQRSGEHAKLTRAPLAGFVSAS